jgi:outer membrane protein assembly factor BamB
MTAKKLSLNHIGLFLLFILSQCSVPTGPVVSSFFQTGNRVLSHPIIDDGVIYFGSNDSTFYAVDLKTGEKKWSYPAGSEIKSSAAVEGSTLYFSSGNHFYAFDKNTGDEIWSHMSGSLVPSKNMDTWDYHHGTPVIHEGKVLFGREDGLLYCFDARDGGLEYSWLTIDSAAIRCTPAIRDQVLYFGDWNGRVYAFDLMARDTLWTYRTYQEQLYPTFGQLNTRFHIHDSLLVFGARNPELQAVNIKTGKKAWSYTEQNGGWISGDPLISGDTLFIGGSDCHKLFAFNVRTGELYWTYELNLNNFSRPIIIGNQILFTAGDAYAYLRSNFGKGYLYALDKKTGTIFNFARTGGNAFTDPVSSGNKLYLGSEDGQIYTVDLQRFLADPVSLVAKGYESVDSITITPNPFVDSTTIRFHVHYETTVRAVLYGFEDNEIQVLQDGPLPGGKHSYVWDGKDSLADQVPAGYYIIEVHSGEYFKQAYIQRNSE